MTWTSDFCDFKFTGCGGPGVTLSVIRRRLRDTAGALAPFFFFFNA